MWRQFRARKARLNCRFCGDYLEDQQKLVITCLVLTIFRILLGQNAGMSSVTE